MTTIIQQMKRIIKLKQLTKIIILAAVTLFGGLTAKAADYVIMANSGGTWHFYAFNSTSNTANYYYAIDATSFSYSTCVWSGSSNSSFRNSNNTSYGLYYNSNSYLQNRDNYDNFTIVGNKIHSNNRYICYYNNTWYTGRTNNAIYTNGISDVLYSIASTTGSWTTPASITGSQVTFSELGSFNYSAEAAYRPTYYTLTGVNTYYVQEGGTPSNTAPASSSTGITYAWAIGNNASYDDGHVRLTSSGSGVTVEYYSYYDTDTQLTLSLTATHTASGSTSNTATKTITFEAPKIDPTSLTITSGNTMTVYVGSTGNITYSLLPDPCYDNVTFASNATSVATVNASGVVTGVSTGTATITVTAYKIDGTTNANLTKTVTVTVKNKVATPVITFAPNREGNTATTTITCATTGATIYYKVNTNEFAEYSSSFTVNEYDVVQAYAVMTGSSASYWDNSATVSETYVSCTTDSPVITYTSNATTATVTITAETGATIYYTYGDNPSAPTTTAYDGTGTTSVTFSGVTNGQIVKAIAKNSTCAASSTVTETIVFSGISGGVVTLNDREDHSWSYYSDASLPAQLHSLNPADVKITYYGNGIMMTGSDDYTASSTDYITSTHADYKVGAKVNVGGENENTFVYYKTLERTDGSTSANPTGRCPYKPIPNPFQVRPRYGDRGTTDANIFTGWRGFQCWRLKSVSGGSVYSAASGGTALTTGAVINAETEIYFAPNAEYGMEVELEAVWAIAYVKKANQDNENPVGTNNVGYERNFCVPTTGAGYTLYTGTGKRITNANHIPVTISRYYPDGTAPDNTNNSISNTATSLTADTKFENIPINLTSNTVTLANYDIIVGRGCDASTINNLQGINAAATDLDYTIRLESGTYNQFCFVRNGTNTTVSGRYLIKAIMGSDYDRATNTNNKLSVSPNSTLFFAQTVGFTGSSNKDQKTFDCVFKSGRYQSEQWNGSIQSGQNGYQHIAYLGQNSAQGNTYPGVRCVTVEGGEFSGMCGGRGVGGNSVDAMTPEVITFDLRITGGTFHGAVYGGAADNPSIGSRRFIITGGEIQSWIAGGCNGTGSTTGTGATDGDSYIYVGGTTLVGGDNTIVINETNAGQVFGAGRGISGRASSVNHSHVAIADEAVIRNGNNNGSYPVGGNVYGGSYNGTIADVSNVYILGGRVEGSAFGGSYGNGTAIPTANVTMTGGLVTNGVYGGSNSTGTVNNVIMHIDGGQVGTSSANANVHGGGYGQATIVAQNVDVTVGTTTQTTPGVTVYGDVYGGSALGSVNGTAATNTYHTYVTLNKGTINGSLYGGGLGNGSTAANVYGPVQVKVFGGSINTTSVAGSGAVYGCNNINGAPQRSVTVDIYGTDPAPDEDHYALDAVYGGGNLASYAAGTPVVTVHNCNNSIGYVYGGGNAAHITNGNTDVTIYGGNKIGNVFGGGNGTVQAANVSGNTDVKIYGGTIGRVFGGSNSQGTIGGTISVTAETQTETGTDPCTGNAFQRCPIQVEELYGGGNLAASNVGNISIGCMNDGDMIDYVYGGANQANITGNIALTMNGGRVGNLFGGNNTSGSISGSITVNVNWNGSCSDNYLGNVFGGGNLATFGTTASPKAPTVNILNGTVSGNVYGGGKGDPNDHTKGQVTGNPVVTIGDNDNSHQAIVSGDVYGGGDAGDVVGTPQVNVINKCNTTIGNVYGGGNAADVDGTDVNIDGGNITGMVFGGGHGNNDPSDLKVANVNGNVDVDITGGTINKVFAGSNLNGAISGAITLDINKSTASGACDMIIGEVYGGGNEAAGNAGTITVGCTGTLTTQASDPDNIGVTLEGIGAVYGGANQADIGTSSANSNITLTINSGMVGNVYGGNNTSGDIHGTIQVNINKNSDACGWYVGDVFGGGNLADYSGTPDVNIQAGTVSGSVFGGGNAASVGGSDVAVSGGQVNGGVYGGCNASGNTGTVTIALTGGQVGTSGSSADVYGGGFGSATTTSGNIGVTLNGTTVYGDIYGGSALGSVNNASADPANTTTLTIGSNTLHGTIYGGGKGSNEGSGTTATSNGNVVINYNTANTNLTGLYGGANINGNVKGDITVNVLANVGSSSTNINVFGGGLGHATNTEGNVTVNVGTADGTKTPTVYGDIYGGSALGNVNNAVADLTTINILNGTVHGNVYGGGLGDATVQANGYLDPSAPTVEAIVNGTVHVNIGDASNTNNTNSTPTIDGKVFGCNNLAGTPKGNVYVDVYRTAHTSDNTYPSPEPASAGVIPTPAASEFAIQEVYGGGNLAHYSTTLENASTYVHIHNCDNTIQYVYGGGNAANTMANEVTIDGGRFEYVFGGGNGAGTGNPGANVEGDATVNLNGGIINYVFGGSNTLGVVNGTASMTFATSPTCTRMVKELYGGGNEAPGGSVNLTIPCGVTGLDVVYGGSRNADIGSETLFNANTKKNVVLTIEGGNLAKVFGGNNQGGIIWGDVTLNLKGGIIVDAFGGNNAGGNIKGNITVNVEEDETLSCPLVLTNVFGGGKDAAYTPADTTISFPQVNINHKKSDTSITGSVFGGGQGATAVVTANPVVTIGDNNANHLATIDGNVYGGGDAAAVTGNTTVTYNDNNASSSVAKLFGGGNAAGVSGTATVTLTSGKVTDGIYGGCNASGSVDDAITVIVNGGTVGTDATHTANVHGGGYGSATSTGDNVTVTIGNGTTTPVIWGDVYGGSALGNINNSSANNTNVTLASGTIHGDLYGGGLGDNDHAALVNGAVQVTVNGGTVTGSIYGCNNANGTPQSTVKVDIFGTDTPASGYALANVFGGGNLAGYTGTPDVTIHNCDNSIGFVYGGGNAAPVAGTNVVVYGGNTIGNVFGGGNGTGVAPTFVMVTGNVSAKIYGGTIEKVFGGNNSSGMINGTVTLNVNKQTEPGQSPCAMKIGEVYGGGNLAAGNAGTITIGCTGTLETLGSGEHYGVDQEGIRYVYGGANQANINNDITLNIKSGIVENVFGGNNTSGDISGTITVNIEKTGDCGWYVGNVYGGGNLADYRPTTAGAYPAVNIKNGTVSGDVFGGGLGASAKVYSNPVVTLGDLTNTTYAAVVNGNVYGGGSAAMVGDDDSSNASINNTTVLIQKNNSSVTKVFGGGMAAGVTGTTVVTIADGTINGGVYGGCDSQGNVTGDITVNVNGGTIGSQANLNQTTPITIDVYGGGYGAATTTSGNVEVNIGQCTSANTRNEYPKIYGDVYGGSALGKVNKDQNNTTTVNILNGTLYTNAESATTTNGQTYYKYHGGNVYGGGLGDRVSLGTGHSDVLAEEYGKIIVNIGASSGSKTLDPTNDTNIGEAVIQGNVYGCNNTNGSPKDDVTVNIYRTHREATDEITYAGTTSAPATYALNDVFGGGNQADYIPAAANKASLVLIHGCYNTVHRVFGGSNAAASGSKSASVKVNTNINGGRYAEVFGGGNGEVRAANIFGNVNLEIHGGLVGEFYVGSNQNGSITGSSNVTVDQSSGCEEITITEFYCGGKYADFVGDIEATITCSEGMNVTNLYGGCKEANVVAGNGGSGNVHITVYGGTYENIYGGSRGTTTVPADIAGNVTLDVFGGTVTNAIFGGSNINGNISGKITVNVEDKISTDACALEVSIADVYGGGNKANYTPTSAGDYPEVNIKNATVKNVFGGGLEADVTANPQIYIKKGSKILGNVYGGGNMGEVVGNPRVIINGKQVN